MILILYIIFLAFASSAGRHNPKSIGRDMKINKLKNLGKNQESNHLKAHDVLDNITKIFGKAGLKSGEHLAIKLIEAGITSITNSNDKTTILTGSQIIEGIGENKSTIYKTNFHCGQPTTKKVKRQANTPLATINKKVLATDLKDYQSHRKRLQLNSKSGFNQKTYCFLMEDTFLTVKNLVKLFDKDKRIKENILKNVNGFRNVYGCIYKTELNVKIISSMDYYSTYIKIHLIKINDIHDNPRKLLTEITNNITSTKLKKDTKKNKKKLRGVVDEVIDEAKNIAKNIGKEEADKLIDKSNLPKETKQTMKTMIQENGTHRAKISDLGKIPEDEQYSDPPVTDKRNKFSCSFCTSTKTKLTDSVLFKDRAKIIHTWGHIMSPGSIWDFNITQHFGKGIFLNYLYDIEKINEEYPAGYFLVVEHMGDKRATVIRKKDNDKFDGNGPSELRYSFENKITYIGIENDDSDFEDDAVPCVYKVKRREEDFIENSEFSKIFTPDRESTFNVDFDDIQLLKHQTKEETENRNYYLEYNSSVMPSPSMLENIKQKYSNLGFNNKSVSVDDLKYNLDNPPSEKEYEGTEGNEDELNLDLEDEDDE
jgi:hypothetical protein